MHERFNLTQFNLDPDYSQSLKCLSCSTCCREDNEDADGDEEDTFSPKMSLSVENVRRSIIRRQLVVAFQSEVQYVTT